MKNTMKKGFSLGEGFFSMAIIAILAGFAIANLKDNSAETVKIEKVREKFSMKNLIIEMEENQKKSIGYYIEEDTQRFYSDRKIELQICKNGNQGFLAFYKDKENANENKSYFYDSCINTEVDMGERELYDGQYLYIYGKINEAILEKNRLKTVSSYLSCIKESDKKVCAEEQGIYDLFKNSSDLEKGIERFQKLQKLKEDSRKAKEKKEKEDALQAAKEKAQNENKFWGTK